MLRTIAYETTLKIIYSFFLLFFNCMSCVTVSSRVRSPLPPKVIKFFFKFFLTSVQNVKNKLPYTRSIFYNQFFYLVVVLIIFILRVVLPGPHF